MQLRLHKKGLKSVTMIGAVTNFHDKLILGTYIKSDMTAWKQFMQHLVEFLDENHIRGKPFLVIDNLTAHRAEAMKEYYERFKVLFLPAYSSTMNCQEACWSIVKIELAKYFARLN